MIATTRSRLVRLAVTLGAAVLLAGSIPLAAQVRQRPGAGLANPAGPLAQPEGLTLGELTRHFEAYELLQAQQALQLSDEQYADFIVRLKALQNARRRHTQNRLRLIGDLRKLTAPQITTPDEAAIRAQLDALTREETTGAEEIRKAMTHLDEVLDLRQRARFRVFEDQLERRKLDLLSRVRQARGQARPPKS